MMERREAGRALRVRPELPDLPDLGAHLRLQPGVRALPVRRRGGGIRASCPPPRPRRVIDELQRMQVFYVNIGGGEPTVRPDFWELLDYAIGHDVGVKFSTNGIKLDKKARRAAGGDRLRRRPDLPRRRDRRGQRPRPRPGLVRHRDPGAGEPGRGRVRPAQDLASWSPARTSTSSTSSRRSPTTSARSCGSPGCAPRGAAPTCGTSCTPRRAAARSSTTGCSPAARTCSPATRSSTSPPTGEALPGLNLCGAGRVVCLIDPVGDVYACPFAIHEQLPRRQRPLARRVPAGVAGLGAVPRPAPSADRRCLREAARTSTPARAVHGGEVLHRTAA